uniref:Uncharacterized protein n=1 Tax=Steinernema glaseri TaxID=37863 RepID=A0A1I7XYR6_9BILA
MNNVPAVFIESVMLLLPCHVKGFVFDYRFNFGRWTSVCKKSDLITRAYSCALPSDGYYDRKLNRVAQLPEGTLCAVQNGVDAEGRMLELQQVRFAHDIDENEDEEVKSSCYELNKQRLDFLCNALRRSTLPMRALIRHCICSGQSDRYRVTIPPQNAEICHELLANEGMGEGVLRHRGALCEKWEWESVDSCGQPVSFKLCIDGYRNEDEICAFLCVVP